MTDFNPEQLRNEKEVESKFIVNYLLPALGYTSNDWYQEVALGGVRLDFLVFASRVISVRLADDTPACLVIEAKSPRRRLDSHVRRLQQYLEMLQTPYGLLTNGKDLHIYRYQDGDMNLIFQCAGQHINHHMDTIKNIVGREALNPKLDCQISAGKEVESQPVAPDSEQTEELQSPLANAPEPSILQPENDPTTYASTQPENPYQVERSDSNMKIIAVYHNKGGVGKTTVSINLAAGLRNRGHRVLLIDLDSQANSTYATGLVKFQFEEDDLRDKNVREILLSGDFDFIPDVVRQSSHFNTPEIDIIPAHISLIEAQYKLNQVRASQTRLIKKLKREEDHYDFVILDTPPSRDIYAQVAIIAAHYLIIPSDMKPFANQGLTSVRSFLKEIDEFREGLGRQPIHILGVMPSKISTNQRAFEHNFPRQKETIIQKYNFPVMDSIIFERVALSHSINQTHTIGDIDIPDPKSIFAYASQNPSANQAAAEFEKLTTEVLNHLEK